MRNKIIMNKKNIVLSVVLLLFIQPLIFADNNDPVKLNVWDLPEKCEFRPVKGNSKIKSNPSYLPENIKILITKRVLNRNMVPLEEFSPDNVNKIYLGIIQLKDNPEIRITYMAYYLPGQNQMESFVKLNKPFQQPVKKGYNTIWFNDKWYITLSLSSKSETVPEEFRELTSWLSERYKKFVKFSY